MKLKDIHWADYAATHIIKKRGPKKEYICAAGITPSGVVHIGNFREIITTDLIVKALERKEKKVKFVYFWDDYDRFRKVPKNLPKKTYKHLEKYIGCPLANVPDPYECHKNYAEHFEKEFEESIKELGLKINFIYQAKEYKKCRYANEIKRCLNVREKIIEILNKYRREPLDKDWWPINIYCENCNKDSIRILDYDGNYKLRYECDCGFSNELDFRKKGVVKLKWRVDWPMRWFYYKIDFEPAGKDHFTKGGSMDTSRELIKDIWNKKEPYSFPYEWISFKGGKQFSSSEGFTISMNDLLEIYEPKVIRYLFVSTRPNVDFAISFDLDVLKIYEDFDTTEKIYFDKLKVNKKREEKEKRNYELSCIKIPKNFPKQVTFRHLTVLTQIYEGDINQVLRKLKNKDIKNRAICAWNWVQKYAPNDMKFKVHDKISKEIKKILTKKQKEALKELYKRLDKKHNEKELFNEFYDICNKLKIKNTEFFEGAYLALIGKKKGPKLAPFILVLGNKRVKNLLKQLFV